MCATATFLMEVNLKHFYLCSLVLKNGGWAQINYEDVRILWRRKEWALSADPAMFPLVVNCTDLQIPFKPWKKDKKDLYTSIHINHVRKFN